MRLEFKEPYPIYRGFFVPIWEERVVKVRRVTKNDVELFKKALEILRNFLGNVGKDPKAVADAIAIFFKAPLIHEISPILPSPLKAHALRILIPDNLEFSEDVYNFAEILSRLRADHMQPVKVLFEKETAEIVEKLWLYFPADTRPGYNTSSLVAHLLLTSAIAWALEVESGANWRGIGIVRVASLLHDIGKFVDPEHHYITSKKIVDYLLKGVLDDELDEICELIEKHHSIVKESISKADKLASAADRVSNIVDKVIGAEINEIERITGKKKDSWSCWKEAYEIKGDFFKELTEKFVEGVGGLASRDEEVESKVKVVLVDIGGIQNFIYRSQEIRNIAMASHIIDLIVHAHFLNYLKLRGLEIPPEAVIYSGGGNILLILPRKYMEKLRSIVKDYEKIVNLKLYVAETEFSTNYAMIKERLEMEMVKRKYSVELSESVEKIVRERLQKVCKLCFSSTAEDEVETVEGTKNVCKVCKRLYEAGSDVHFKPRWETKIKVLNDEFSPKDVFGRDWNSIARYIMEIIAGHDAEEIERLGGEVTLRDIAVITFDGNMMGAFMSGAISFTDAVERSFRVDIAVKKAYRKALEAIYSSVGGDDARKICSRIFLGTIYIGGDDGLIFVPSWLALPFAHLIAEEFTKQLGLLRGISVGVTAGSPRMSVWSLMDCSSSLMKLAKRYVRENLREKPGISAVCFLGFDSGSPSGSVAEQMLKMYSPRLNHSNSSALGLSLQPYIIHPNDSELWKLFSLISENRDLVKIAYSADETKLLNRLRNAVMDCWNAARNSKYWKEILLVYIKYQKAKSEGEDETTKEIYRKLDDFAKHMFVNYKAIPLIDVLTFCKLIRGGAR